DVTALCKKIVMSANRGKQHSIIIKAEGVDITTQELVDEIEKRTGRETKMVILSYLQRGGSPTMRDRILATLCGSKAVDLLKEDSESKAIGTEDGAIVSFDLLEALEQTRELDMEMYDLIGVLSK
ncbi:MAG: ATP-dependent 6-phosphofructokinase, partial [Clostridiales bacterium]|nr:ATP-dependent 6-phosphofructokinase [Clostridiales bacterium]